MRCHAARRQHSHIHLAESRAEYEYVIRAAGPLADFWRNRGYGDISLLRQGGAGASPVAYAASTGVLDSCTHIAHGVYVDDDDREILRRTGTVVALCPRSNAVCAAIVEGGGGMTEATKVAGEVRFRRARRRPATATAGGTGPPGSLPAGAHTDRVG
ncbi:hypothetical protein ACIG56_01430 [Nocardia fusca]|uniref:hypothetical protein n=1 Tax=Nocardia fusca TaxID=941183 RepID=UPI0037C8F29E